MGATYRRSPTVRWGAPDRPLTVHSVAVRAARSTGCRRTAGSASARPGTVAPMTTTLTARRPEDLLAAVPVVLGFRPHDSLVMLTFDAARTFHARVDLPPSAEAEAALPELVDALVSPCLTHRVGRVAFVSYSDDAGLSARVAAALRAAFGRAGHRRDRRAACPRGRVAASPRPSGRPRERGRALRRRGPPVRGTGGLRGAGDPRQPRGPPRHPGVRTRGGGPGDGAPGRCGRLRAGRRRLGGRPGRPVCRGGGDHPTTPRRRGCCVRWSGSRSATRRSTP